MEALSIGRGNPRVYTASVPEPHHHRRARTRNTRRQHISINMAMEKRKTVSRDQAKKEKEPTTEPSQHIIPIDENSTGGYRNKADENSEPKPVVYKNRWAALDFLANCTQDNPKKPLSDCYGDLIAYELMIPHGPPDLEPRPKRRGILAMRREKEKSKRGLPEDLLFKKPYPPGVPAPRKTNVWSNKAYRRLPQKSLWNPYMPPRSMPERPLKGFKTIDDLYL
ncbi:unnamed protein product [Caenorhabditis auriculariae]|uniref:Uncharacterized protein n=1 Tax=Caenorhabditis auriculariae TaxID=2777116 RepID=A0A8S1H208_9PELO|nr:unnamed protein product [Caenorhabditis auriculariae]